MRSLTLSRSIYTSSPPLLSLLLPFVDTLTLLVLGEARCSSSTLTNSICGGGGGGVTGRMTGVEARGGGPCMYCTGLGDGGRFVITVSETRVWEWRWEGRLEKWTSSSHFGRAANMAVSIDVGWMIWLVEFEGKRYSLLNKHIFIRWMGGSSSYYRVLVPSSLWLESCSALLPSYVLFPTSL